MSDATREAYRSQSEKFKEAARKIGADECDARWDDRLKEFARA